MEGPSVASSSGHSAGAGVQSPHGAFCSVRYICAKNSMTSFERGAACAPAALTAAPIKEKGLYSVKSEEVYGLPSSAVHLHDVVSSPVAGSHPENADLPAAAGWDCSFCLTQREAEDFAKTYTSLLVKSQQDGHNQETYRSSVDQQQTHKWQQQRQHQQRGQLRLSQQHAVQEQLRQLRQPAGDWRDRKHNQPITFRKPTGLKDADASEALTASHACVNSCMAVAFPARPDNPSGGSSDKGTAPSSSGSSAHSEYATRTAVAYVNHLTFHRENERNPSPRRVPVGFVAQKYAQNVIEREDRLIHAAVAMAGEYTRSLFCTRVAPITCESTARECSQNSTDRAFAEALGGYNVQRSRQASIDPEPALQQAMQPRRQQPHDNAALKETQSIIDDMRHHSEEQLYQNQMKASCAHGGVRRNSPDEDGHQPAVTKGPFSSTVVTRDVDIDEGVVEDHTSSKVDASEEGVVAGLKYKTTSDQATEEVEHVNAAAADQQRTQNFDADMKVSSKNVVGEEQSLNAASSTAEALPRAKPRLPKSSNPDGMAATQVNSRALAVRTWLCERQKLQSE